MQGELEPIFSAGAAADGVGGEVDTGVDEVGVANEDAAVDNTDTGDERMMALMVTPVVAQSDAIR